MNRVPQMGHNAIQGTVEITYGHCTDCGRKHLFQDCPHHPDKKGKATVNIVEVLPSTSGSKSEQYVPIAVVTKAHAQKEAINQEDI